MRLKTLRFPAVSSSRMSTMSTSAIAVGAPERSMRWGSRRWANSPRSARYAEPRSGVALPSTTTAPLSSARFSATSRAWYRGESSVCL